MDLHHMFCVNSLHAQYVSSPSLPLFMTEVVLRGDIDEEREL